MSAPKVETVFISYSHKDERWKDRLLPHLHALVEAGVQMRVWHDRKIDGGDRWYPEITTAMDDSVAAILLISANFLSSNFCVHEEVPALLKRQEEKGMLLIPVLVLPCVWKAHRWLKSRQMIPRDGKCVANDFPGDQADTVFAEVAIQVFTHFEALEAARTAPPYPLAQFRTANAAPPPLSVTSAVAWPVLDSAKIDLTRLPETGSALFGRDTELELLDNAWASAEKRDAEPTRILIFTAHGGVGKSTLVNHWLAEMERENYRGAARIFGWSFYSQGVRTESVASADTFINAALRFFGDTDPTSGSPWDKGTRLAHLIGQQRALLVLDGLEPLQSAHAFERGKLREPALESLLRGLARQSAGLCLITTRELLPDLAGRKGVLTHDLEQISAEAGRALLRTARVVGTDAELQALAARFGPHALAISLLGVFLHEHPGHGVGPAEILERMPGAKPIDRVLAGFEQLLGDSPERETLRLLGFFDRPADAGCLRALRASPVIDGLTNRLSDLDETGWNRVLVRLEKLRLIQIQKLSSGEVTVDAHPLIREHFMELLKTGSAWREGHQRLYEYLCASTQEGDRPTLEDLQPLYQAVAHGCYAGLQQKACDEVYYIRICRKGEYYATKKLGAYGADLGAIACFFESPWAQASQALTESDHAWLLGEAAYRLRALGRLTEALVPIRASLQMRVSRESWQNASIGAGHLSVLEARLGKLAEAERDAAKSVIYADRSSVTFQRMSRRATHGDVLHQAGRRAEAETRFREAEEMGAKDQPRYPLLYSLQGFFYCDLLLVDAERAAWSVMLQNAHSLLTNSCRTVSDRAMQTLRWAEQNRISLVDEPVDHLTLSRAALYASILKSPISDLKVVLVKLDSVVAGLRGAGDQEYFPFGLLTRAWLHYLRGNRIGSGSAQSDLDEAWEIAERGLMRLHMADIHLYRARLFGRKQAEGGQLPYPWESPEADLKAARELIEKCGYWRRKEELEDAEAAILGKSGGSGR